MLKGLSYIFECTYYFTTLELVVIILHFEILDLVFLNNKNHTFMYDTITFHPINKKKNQIFETNQFH